MNANDVIKQLLLSFNNNDKDAFLSTALEYIEREKRMNHTQVVRELEKVLFDRSGNSSSFTERRFKNTHPIPRDTEKGFPLLEIRNYDECFEDLIISDYVKEQLDQIIREFKDADILASYNLSYKRKILLCGKPGTGKTYTAKIVSSLLGLPLVYIRFDSIISSYLGETASNLRKVFDYIEDGTWIVLFDEFDIIGKNRDDIYEHGEIKRVVNNFLQMLDNYEGSSILFAATNHQYLLDPAIWRRFDDVLFYDLPDLKTRQILFSRFLKSLQRDQNINFQFLSEKSEGLSHADIQMIAIEAMKFAIIDERKTITKNDLYMALDRFLRREKSRTTSKGD